LDENYPLNGTCQRKDDKENYGKKRSEVTKLDINNNNLTLTGELTLTGFTNLTKLNCYANKLTKLDLSNCSKLTKLDC
jgi:Leucine-rich repeat (LRR) protein